MRIDALVFDRDEKRLSMTVSDALFRGATCDESGLMHGDRAFVMGLLAHVARAARLDERAFVISGSGSIERPTYVIEGRGPDGAHVCVVVDALGSDAREAIATALDDVLTTVYALLKMP
jgi:hypothetical protein